MSVQHQEVFRLCIDACNEFEAAKRDEHSVAILRALIQYLDVMPATGDKSCRAYSEGRLAKAYGRVREKELKREKC
jgi:hypothetical protein